MHDDQQRPPAPLRSTGSFPPGATPPTVPWTEPPVFSTLHAPRTALTGTRQQWPGRRTLRPGEQVWVGVIAALVAGYVVLIAATADWTEHPLLAVLATVTGIAGVAALAASARARRPDDALVRGLPLRRLPRPERGHLARELRAGRPGPPELRPYAVAWTCQSLQAPWTPALFLLVGANSTATTIRSGATPTWQQATLAVLLAVAAVALGYWTVRRRAAQRVADALDRLAPPPPRTPSSS